MNATLRALLLSTVIVLSAHSTPAFQSRTVEIKELAVITLANLFRQSDTVALVKIVSGDAENYSVAVYKGEVIKSFKGVATGATIYFGPYVGERLGWEYVLFLRNVSKPIAPRSAPSAGYGPIQYSEIFNEGYSSMTSSYECVFSAKADSGQCDYGVRVCTDYIVLPKSTPTFPPESTNTDFGCRFVRKQSFIALLESLGNSKEK
jgi:hypothetical protein